uniref:Unannotated protein n=1 Tax=freshwater metagenome TaxID=449393 RepID=A0A6J7PSL6_9ZZZZ
MRCIWRSFVRVLVSGVIVVVSLSATSFPAIARPLPVQSRDSNSSTAGGMAADWVWVDASGPISDRVIAVAQNAASRVGGRAAVIDGGTLDLLRIRRNGEKIFGAPAGFSYRVTFRSIGIAAGETLFGPEVGTALAKGEVVMDAATARRRGALVGDMLTIVSWNQRTLRLRLGAVSGSLPSDLLFSQTTARYMGVRRHASVIIYGLPSRESIDSFFVGFARFFARHRVRPVRTWDRRFADEILDTRDLDSLLGEVPSRGANALAVPDSWRSANIIPAVFRVGGRRFSTHCNAVVARAAQAAFDELTVAGLASVLDTRDTDNTGGCYQPRRARTVLGGKGGTVSRHTWGAAIDLNPTTNCVGCAPRLPCAVVQIFRSHGFAWGGNFLVPDGMHFEWVGERRDRHPSRPGDRCPTRVLMPAG